MAEGMAEGFERDSARGANLRIGHRGASITSSSIVSNAAKGFIAAEFVDLLGISAR